LKASILITCLADNVYPRVGLAMARVLERLGCAVDFPEAQTCCGQPAFNSGYVQDARSSALTLLEAFESSERVVSPSGSCAGMVKHYFPELFASDPSLKKRAEALAAKTYEFSQFVVGVLGKTELGARLQGRATYHPSCHATRLLGVAEEPLALLGAVRGLTLEPLPRAEDCCGFGGTFAVKMDELSAAMASDKAAQVASTQASYLVGTDMGCLMNISGVMEKRGMKVEALHLAELLDRGMA
jgi:L-lactate dehydrogenase complex protein LldE